MPKRLVISSEASRASIMAGIPGQIIEEEEVPTPGLQASGEPQEPAAPEPTPEPTEPTEPPAAAAEPTGTQLEAAPSELHALLKETMAETKLMQESLIRLQLEHEKAVKDVTELQAMRPALEKSIQRLEVGLGHRPSLLDGLSATALVGTYDQLYAELMKLPVGQHTLAAAEVPDLDQAQTIMQQRLTSIPGGKR